ncbi:MAG: hypothetical protein WBC91_08045 [Phototrophicaceae bacterium]
MSDDFDPNDLFDDFDNDDDFDDFDSDSFDDFGGDDGFSNELADDGFEDDDFAFNDNLFDEDLEDDDFLDDDGFDDDDDLAPVVQQDNGNFRTIMFAMAGLFVVGIILIILLVIFQNAQQNNQNTAFEETRVAIEIINATSQAQIEGSATAAIVGQTATLQAQVAGTQTQSAVDRSTEQANIAATATGAVVVQTQTEQAFVQATQDALDAATQAVLDAQLEAQAGATQTAVVIEMTLNPVNQREPLIFNGQPVQTADGTPIILIDGLPFVIINTQPVPVAPGSPLQTADGTSVTVVDGEVVAGDGTDIRATQAAFDLQLTASPVDDRPPAELNGETVQTSDGTPIIIIDNRAYTVINSQPVEVPPDTQLETSDGTPIIIIGGLPVEDNGTQPMPTQGESVSLSAVQQTATALANLFDATPTQAAIVPTTQLGQGGGIATTVAGVSTPNPGQGGGDSTALPDTGLIDDVFGGNPMVVVLIAFGLFGLILVSRGVRSANREN